MHNISKTARSTLGMSSEPDTQSHDDGRKSVLLKLIRPTAQYTVIYMITEDKVQSFESDANCAPVAIEPADAAQQGRDVLGHRSPTLSSTVFLVCHLDHIGFLNTLTKLGNSGEIDDLSDRIPGAYPMIQK